MTTLRGVLPVFQTPFKRDETVDFDRLSAEIRWIAEQGAHGVVFGMVSETLRLGDAERADVVRVAAQAAAAAGLPCVASVGAESTSLAVRRAQQAIEAGATALMATPPLNGRQQPDQLYDYYRAIVGEHDGDVVIQDASGYVGQPLSIGMQADLFGEFGDRVCFKPEAVPLVPTLDALRQATEGRARVFEGMGGAALPDAYPGGVSGTMPGAEVCWAVVAMWNALTDSDPGRARTIQEPLAEMISLQSDLDSFVVCEKFLLVEQGVLTDPTARGPLGYTLSAADQQRLRVLLRRLSSIVRESAPVPARAIPAS